MHNVRRFQSSTRLSHCLLLSVSRPHSAPRSIFSACYDRPVSKDKLLGLPGTLHLKYIRSEEGQGHSRGSLASSVSGLASLRHQGAVPGNASRAIGLGEKAGWTRRSSTYLASGMTEANALATRSLLGTEAPLRRELVHCVLPRQGAGIYGNDVAIGMAAPFDPVSARAVGCSTERS